METYVIWREPQKNFKEKYLSELHLKVESALLKENHLFYRTIVDNLMYNRPRGAGRSDYQGPQGTRTGVLKTGVRAGAARSLFLPTFYFRRKLDPIEQEREDL